MVKNQQQLQNTAIQKTADQLQTLSDTVADLAQNLPSASPSLIQSNGLRLPNLIIPIYTGLEHLDRFITQLESILKSSNVPSQYWLTYLKQQTQQDARAYNAICEAETANSLTNLGPDSTKTSPAEFTNCTRHVSPPSKRNAENRGTINSETCWARITRCINNQMKV